MSEARIDSPSVKKYKEIAKIGHRRVTTEGTVTYKRKTTSEIQTAIQLGIKVSVTLSHEKVKRDMLLKDFGVVETLSFPRAGSKDTPPHDLSDFKFKTFAPIAFRYFRDVFQVNVNDFLNSLCDQELQELSNAGASGSIFYITLDDEFIIKTVQHKEANFLQKLLPEYYINLIQHPRTLLPKFYGLYCYQTMGKNIRFVIMNNLLPSITIHERYDLKGSTYKRMANDREKAKDSPTLKDLDFREKHKEGIFLEIETYDALLNTIQRDCRVLESFSIMDYSLLLGVHNLDKSKRANRKSENQALDGQLSLQTLVNKPPAVSFGRLEPDEIIEYDFDPSGNLQIKSVTHEVSSLYKPVENIHQNVESNPSIHGGTNTDINEMSDVINTESSIQSQLTKKYRKLEDVVVAAVVKNEAVLELDSSQKKNYTASKLIDDTIKTEATDIVSNKSDKLKSQSDKEKHEEEEQDDSDVDLSDSDSGIGVLEWANIKTTSLRAKGSRIMEISFRNMIKEYLIVLWNKLFASVIKINPLKLIQWILMFLQSIIYYLFFRDCDVKLYNDNEIPNAVLSTGSTLTDDYTNRLRHQSSVSINESFMTNDSVDRYSINSFEFVNNFNVNEQINQNNPTDSIQTKGAAIADSTEPIHDFKELTSEIIVDNDESDNKNDQSTASHSENTKPTNDTNNNLNPIQSMVESSFLHHSQPPEVMLRLNRQDSRMKSIKRIAAYSTVMESIQAPMEDMDLGSSEEEIVPSGGIPARNSAGDRLILFMGIIDILQSYRLAKKMEHNFKAIFLEAETISVCNPTFYAFRFQDFFAETVFKKVSSSMKSHSSKFRKIDNNKDARNSASNISRKELWNFSESKAKEENIHTKDFEDQTSHLLNEIRKSQRKSVFRKPKPCWCRRENDLDSFRK